VACIAENDADAIFARNSFVISFFCGKLIQSGLALRPERAEKRGPN